MIYLSPLWNFNARAALGDAHGPVNVSIIFLRVFVCTGGYRSRRHISSLKTTSCPSVIKQTTNTAKVHESPRGDNGLIKWEEQTETKSFNKVFQVPIQVTLDGQYEA